MKKVLCMLLAAALVCSLAACEPSGGNVKPTPAGKPVPTPTEAPAVIDDDVIKEKTPVLTVSGGQIQGYYTDDKTVRVYKGVPYAEAERFKAPVETRWEGLPEWKANENTFGNIDYSYMELNVPCVWKTTADSSVQLIEKQYADIIQELESISPLNPQNAPAEGASD